MKKNNLVFVQVFASLFILLAGFVAGANERSIPAITAAEAAEIGEEAYIWGLSLVEVYRTMKVMTDLASGRKNTAPMNKFLHMDKLVTPEFKEVVRPNNDTLYSVAWLDLRSAPVTLEVPPMQDRYFVFQLMDAYSNTFTNVSRRTVGSQGAKVVIVGPDWNGKLPTGYKPIYAPTALVWVAGRTLVGGSDDVENVRQLQSGYLLKRVTKNGELHATSANQPEFPGDVALQTPAGLDYFKYLGVALSQIGFLDIDEDLVERFERIGLSAKTGFSLAGLPNNIRNALLSSIPVAQQKISQSLGKLGREENGWLIFQNIGDYGKNYGARAAVAKFGLGANVGEESLYAILRQDEEGKVLNGQQEYVLEFRKQPPTNGFWSLTLYNQSQYLVENRLNRYSIGDRTSGINFSSMGGFNIYLGSSVRSEYAGNWLPAPNNGPFSLILRVYEPAREMIDGAFELPKVKKI